MAVAQATRPSKEEFQAQGNYLFYAPAFLKIQTEDKKLVKFKFNEIQLILHDIIEHIKAQGRLVRVLILKARREGVTTYWTGKFYHSETHNFNRYAYIITHEPDATDFVFDMVKRYYNNITWKPQTKYNNKKILQFNNDAGTGLDSAIRVATAGKEDIGSSQLVHDLLLSEMAKYPAHITTDLLTSILQCIPDEPDTNVVMESTAKGIGGEFYTRFWAAKYRYEVYLENGKPTFKCTVNTNAKEDNIYSSIFIPWFVFTKYERDVPPDFKRTKEEEHLAKVHGLTDRKLQWRRWAIENKCGSSVDTFRQEYPSTPREAFLSSGRPVFDVVKVEALMKMAKPPIAKYEILMSNGSFVFNASGRFWTWEEPAKGRSYVIAADVAEGLEHGDFDSADVIDQLTGQQVAHWHGHMAPDLFGVLLFWMARRYNMAWIVPERNNHGLMTVTKLADMKYPHLYAERVPDPPHRPRQRYGWLTTKASKFPIIDNLAAEIRQNIHGIRCYHTFEEMLSFKQKDDGTLGAEEGMWDDRVLSYAIAKYVRMRLPVIVQPMQSENAHSVNLEGSRQQFVNLGGSI